MRHFTICLAILLGAGCPPAPVRGIDGGPLPDLAASPAPPDQGSARRLRSQQDIQDALSALGALGVLSIPAGRYQIDGTLEIPAGGIVLLGAGPDQTIFYRQKDGTATPLVHVAGRGRVRISGIGFQGAAAPDSSATEVGVLLEDAANFRVDHASFTHLGFAGVRTSGASYGVVDHCTFTDQYKPAVGTDGYGVVVYGTGKFTGEPYGTEKATFVEDSTFILCRHAVAANDGARYVFRHNQVAKNIIAHAVDAHGAEFGSAVGTEWIDVNNNVIDTPIYTGYALRIRGGAGIIWSNTFSGYALGVELTQDTSERTGPVHIWNDMLTPTGPMVQAQGTAGTPDYTLTPQVYTPLAYPHPLAAPP